MAFKIKDDTKFQLIILTKKSAKIDKFTAVAYIGKDTNFNNCYDYFYNEEDTFAAALANSLLNVKNNVECNSGFGCDAYNANGKK